MLVPAPFNSVVRSSEQDGRSLGTQGEAEVEDTEGVDLMRAIVHEQWPRRDEL